jgi:DNA-binding transcriptional ArsR family regulator
MTELPMRDITDLRALRAMAHPVRLKLLNTLAMHGPATATELANEIDDTPANCSWHLRQLAKFGFIEEATDLPYKGRNRPWRWVPAANRWGGPDASEEFVAATAEAKGILLSHELAERRTWEANKVNEAPEWQDASFIRQSITWLTADELAEAKEVIHEMVLRHYDRAIDPAKRPKGSRPVRFVAWGNPAH